LAQGSALDEGVTFFGVDAGECADVAEVLGRRWCAGLD